MSESQSTPTQTADPQEVSEVIAELEQYRQRIIDENIKIAKQIKLPKKKVMDQLSQHPEITRIDTILESLRSRQAAGGNES